MSLSLQDLACAPLELEMPDPAEFLERFRTLRVASLHVDGWLGDWPSRLEMLAKTWPQVEPDVLLLQGCCARSDEDQVLEIAHKLGYSHVVNAVGLRDAPRTESSAVLSRLPLMDAHVEVLPGPYNRLAAGAVLRLGQRRIRVASVHVPEKSPVETAKKFLTMGSHEEVIWGCCLSADVNAQDEQKQNMRKAVTDAGCSFACSLKESSYPVAREQQLRLWHEKTGDHGEGLDLSPRRCDVIIQRGIACMRSGMIALTDDKDTSCSGHSLVWADYSV